MPRKKPVSVSITEEEKKEYNIGENYLDARRSDNGYIQVVLKPQGAAMLNNQMDDKIEQKIKELEALRKQRSHYETVQESMTKKDKKKLKKEKKKKKKDKKKLKNMPESTKLLFGAIEEYQDKFHKKKGKKDKFDGVTSKDKNAPKKEQLSDEEKEQRRSEREKKEFDKKFEEPLALIRENLIDMTQALSDVNEMIKETKESRARSKHIMLKDLITTKTSLFTARATSARAIADIQKVRLDLEMKKTKESGNVDEKTKNIALMNKFFPQLLATGSLNSKSSKNKDDDEKEYKKDKKKKKNRDHGDEENFDKHVSKLIKSGDIDLSPHEIGIEMEGKYTVQIMYNYKDPTDYKPIAVDNNGKIIKDFKDKYPGLLPKKKDLDLKIDTEKDLARCKKTDQVFNCIGVPYLY